MSTTTWSIDPTHSEILFKVKHLMINSVTGRFNKFEGQLTSTAEDFSGANISFSADVASIDTNMEMRDNHLRSDDFFAAEKYPQIRFSSTRFEKTGADTYRLTGDFTIRDITRPIELAVEYQGTATDFYGNTKAGFELTGKISRKEFGLVWNGVTESGGIVVGDEVKLTANVQLKKEA
ncbi:MAG: YceI family protein [Chitinophagales bacterium]